MVLRIIKIIIYLLAGAAFLDLLLRPHIRHADADFDIIINYPRLLILSIAVLIHVLFAANDGLSLEKNVIWRKIIYSARLFYIPAILYFANHLFTILSFHEPTDFDMVVVHLLPFPLVMHDLLKKGASVRYFQR